MNIPIQPVAIEAYDLANNYIQKSRSNWTPGKDRISYSEAVMRCLARAPRKTAMMKALYKIDGGTHETFDEAATALLKAPATAKNTAKSKKTKPKPVKIVKARRVKVKSGRKPGQNISRELGLPNHVGVVAGILTHLGVKNPACNHGWSVESLAPIIADKFKRRVESVKNTIRCQIASGFNKGVSVKRQRVDGVMHYSV